MHSAPKDVFTSKHSAHDLLQLQPLGRTEQPLAMSAGYGSPWPSGLHRNSPQGLNISSIRVFAEIRDLEIPITLRPRGEANQLYFLTMAEVKYDMK